MENLISIPAPLQQLIWNGKRVHDGDMLDVAGSPFHTLTVQFKGGALRGGKGGFGSMLRSMGAKAAQKETTNFEACRDLNGRRLRNVHDQANMVDYLKKTDDIEKEKEEAKRRKREKLTRGPLHAFDHQKHGTEVRDAKEKVEEALNEVLKKRKFEGSSTQGTEAKAVSKTKKLKMWGDEDEDDSDSDSDAGDVSEVVDIQIAKSTSTISTNIKESPAKVDMMSSNKPEVQEVKDPVSDFVLNLEDMNTLEDVEALGLDRLKDELKRRGLKVGGALRQRAERLWAVRGVSPENIPKCLKSK
eukprot:CFRG1293T1